MKETYYIFKEEDLKRVSGPVQNEWDKTAIFKQELLDICKKVTADDEKLNNADEVMRIHHEFAENWISCSDMMPDEPGVHVLVTDGVHIMESWYEIIDGEMLWVDNYTMYVNIKFGEVTHWMPLPEFPKAKQ